MRVDFVENICFSIKVGLADIFYISNQYLKMNSGTAGKITKIRFTANECHQQL